RRNKNFDTNFENLAQNRPERPNRLNRGPNRLLRRHYSKGGRGDSQTLTIPSNYHNFLIRAPIAAPFAATRRARRALQFYPNKT
ncbi:hypothetical protein S245_004291, partial [Arachis hypogaea]